jgi:CRP/FNR family transcriptional regulator, polysaccharide utilization system transcription regulator
MDYINETTNPVTAVYDEIPFIKLLTDEEAESLKENSNIVKYRKKEVIFRQGTRTSHMMFIRSGYVKIYKEGRNNKFIVLKVAKPGNFLGLMSIFGGQLHQYSASAIDEVEIVYIDFSTFYRIIQNNGQFSIKLIQILSTEGLYIFDRLMSQSHKQLPGRIADVLLYFSEHIYNSNAFVFPFTRRELAELAGTTKESFIRTLTEFKNDKIIKLDGSKVEIVSTKIVKTLSDLG